MAINQRYIPDTWKTIPPKTSVTITFNVWQYCAVFLSLFNVFIPIPAKLGKEILTNKRHILITIHNAMLAQKFVHNICLKLHGKKKMGEEKIATSVTTKLRRIFQQTLNL